MISGHVPTLTCEDPVPEACSCTCSDGMTFNQSRPPVVDPAPPPAPPPVEPPVQLDDKPCTTEIIESWQRLELRHEKNSYEPSEMKTKDINYPEDTILVVADASRRCQHFEVTIDGEVIGTTYGTGPLDNFDCGSVDNCINNHGGSVGYFTLPKGKSKSDHRGIPRLNRGKWANASCRTPRSWYEVGRDYRAMQTHRHGPWLFPDLQTMLIDITWMTNVLLEWLGSLVDKSPGLVGSIGGVVDVGCTHVAGSFIYSLKPSSSVTLCFQTRYINACNIAEQALGSRQCTETHCHL